MEELCRRADVHPSTFRYWKSGRSTPSVAIVQALLDAGLAAVEAAAQAELDDKMAPLKRKTPVDAETKPAPTAPKRRRPT